MKTITQRLPVVLLLTILFAACSRPVAYFQKSPREHHTPALSAVSKNAPTQSTDAMPNEKSTGAFVPAPAEPSLLAETAPGQAQALATTRQSAADKSLQKRMNRVQALLASASVKAAATPSAVSEPRKANLVERLMVKKMNRKINRQLAPENPNKPMLNTGILATGAVLVLIGLLLLLLTSGTASTVGIIVLLAGAVLLLVGLL